MASSTGSVAQKHNHTDCCGCFVKRKEKLEKDNPLRLATPPPLTRSTHRLTEKDIMAFSKLVRVDEADHKVEDHNADESISSEEVKTIEVVFSKIHGVREDKK
jgi:hypothetical protein